MDPPRRQVLRLVTARHCRVVEHVGAGAGRVLAAFCLLLAGPAVGARAVLASDPLPHVLRDCQGGAEEHAVREAHGCATCTNAMQGQPYTRRLGSLVERKSREGRPRRPAPTAAAGPQMS